LVRRVAAAAPDRDVSNRGVRAEEHGLRAQGVGRLARAGIEDAAVLGVLYGSAFDRDAERVSRPEGHFRSIGPVLTHLRSTVLQPHREANVARTGADIARTETDEAERAGFGRVEREAAVTGRHLLR